jgi:hypothetical protein
MIIIALWRKVDARSGLHKIAKILPVKEHLMLIKTLKWPVISLLITGATHFVLEAIWPNLKDLFVAPSLAPLLLAFGIWVGYKAVHNGGNYLNVILAGVILGILPLVLETFGFGMILGFAGRFFVGVYGFAMILFGSLVGGGFALSRKESNM